MYIYSINVWIFSRSSSVNLDICPAVDQWIINCVSTINYLERKCQGFYAPPGVRHQVNALCSTNAERRRTGKDVCICVTSASCPKVLSRGKSVKLTTESRLNLTCRSSTKFGKKIATSTYYCSEIMKNNVFLNTQSNINFI